MKTNIPTKLTTLALAMAFLTTQAHAVLLQLDLTSSPQVNVAATWTDNGTESTSQNQAIFNTGTAIPISSSYGFDGGNVTGAMNAELTVGTSDTLTLDLVSISQDNNSGGSGLATLTTLSTWTVEIVAETGETNGTPVDIDWYAFLTGEVTQDALAGWTITIDGNVVYSETEELGNIGSALQFNDAEGDTLSGYSIGDTFTLDFEFSANTTDVAEAEFSTGSEFTLTATVVPEPTSAALLLGAAGLALLRRRKEA